MKGEICLIEIFTDGACSGNPGPGGFGVVIIEYQDDVEHGIIKEQYQKACGDTTNNREEMKAILYAMIHYGKTSPQTIVWSDSAYAVNTFTNWMNSWKNNGWKKSNNKTPENLDLVMAYDDLKNKGYNIDLRKIKGHAGHEYNELADKLATFSIKL